jgi:hypothetical protein
MQKKNIFDALGLGICTQHATDRLRMKTNTLRIALVSAAFAVLGACGPTPKTCTKNTDCTTGQVCTAGKCVAGTGGGTATGGSGNTGGSGTTGGGSATGGAGNTGGGTATGGSGATGGGDTGGGTATTGGGTATTGGGTATTGGGTATSGGGTATTGGGTATTGGGTATTGGGTATTGGGTATTGGGTATTGGGTATTGGGTATTGGGTATTGGGTAAGGGAAIGGETCAMPTTITAGTIVSTTTGAMNDYDIVGDQGGCEGISTTGAPDTVYKITVGGNSRLAVNLTQIGADGGVNTSAWDPTLNLTTSPSACGMRGPDGGTQAAVCVAGSDTSSAENASFNNLSPNAQDVFVVVDGWLTTSNGAFNLTTTVSPIAAGELCGNAPTIIAGTQSNQATTGFVNDYGTGTNCAAGTAGGFDRVYKVNVAMGQRLTVTATASTSVLSDGGMAIGFNPTINIVDSMVGCMGTLSCLTGSNTQTGAVETAIYDNRFAGKDVFIIVDTSTVAPTGTFALDVTLAAAPVEVVGDSCTAPFPLLSSNVSNVSWGPFTNNYSSSTTGCSGLSGADVVYPVSIAVNSRLTVSATGTSTLTDGGLQADGGLFPGADYALNFVAAGQCGAGISCTTTVNSNLGGISSSETVNVDNTTGQPLTGFIVLDKGALVSTRANESYSLTYAGGSIPVGESCDNTAPAITASTNLAGQTMVGFINNYAFGGSPGCSSSGTLGQDRVYLVTIPAMLRIRATVTAAAGWDPSLNLVSNCSANPQMCLSGVNTTGVSDVLTYNNPTAQPVSAYLIVDTTSSVASTFDLDIVYEAIPAPLIGETCTNPQVIAVSGMLPGQTTTGYANDVSTVNTVAANCGGYSFAGPDRVYSIVVPAGQKLTSTMTPVAGLDLGIYLIDPSVCGLSIAMCLNGSDANGAGVADAASYTNSTGADRTVFIVVDYFTTGTTAGDFSLNNVIGPP